MSYYNNKKDDDDDTVEAIGKVVGAFAGVAFAAWGAYKLFSGSESSSRKEADAAPLAYCQRQGLGGWPSRPSGSAGSFIPNEAAGAEKWRCPAKGWVKVNTDASLKGNNNSSVAIGGVIRDHNGVWKIGFSGRIIPGCTIPQAELWAIRIGLKTAWDEGFTQIVIETDSQEALRLLDNEKVSKHYLERALVDDCRYLIEEFNKFAKKQIPKKCNKVADIMADLGHDPDSEISNFSDENEKMEYYDKPPPEVHFHYDNELD